MATEREQGEINRALDALRPYVLDLRKRGYDASPWIEKRGEHFTVELRIRIPALGVPVESVG